ILQFANPQAAWEFIEKVDRLKAAGFTLDELNWILASDLTAKTAPKETNIARFLTALRKDLQAIKTEYDPKQYDFLTITPPTDVNSLTTLLTSLLQKLGRDETGINFLLAVLQGSFETVFISTVEDIPGGFSFPGAISDIPIHYDQPSKTLSFTGLMTDSQKTILLTNPALANVIAIDSYKRAINDLAQQSQTASSAFISIAAEVQGWPLGFDFPLTLARIPIRSDGKNLRFTGVMTTAQRSTLLNDPSLAAVKDIQTYQQAIEKLFRKPGTVSVAGLPSNFTFPATITGIPNNIPIQIEQVLRFTGGMTTAQQTTLLNDPSLAAVKNIQAYKDVINDFFRLPRLVVKFYKSTFTTQLDNLPPAIDFKAQLPADLATKISYDTEQRLLSFVGIMTQAERAALDALVPNTLPLEVAYHNAVNDLATQPEGIILPNDRIWLTDNDLDTSILANNTLAKRLANAANKALSYLSSTISNSAVLQQSSVQLGLTEAVTRHLFTQYMLLPDSLLKHLTDTFAVTT
ncbi:MAG: hypothetical protein LH647_22975, partial [Leptolyngbyaceae cyanobacterium CAN_BIN12]|nr:hypothetical protein [Leptolyngbyaceae cyanobacterium CAN_BIN12]